MTGHIPRFEILTEPQRRRRWSASEKLAMVELELPRFCGRFAYQVMTVWLWSAWWLAPNSAGDIWPMDE